MDLMLIVYACPKGIGWHPITYMASLAAELLEAELVILDNAGPRLIQKLEALLLTKRSRKNSESLLLICPDPGSLLSLLTLKGWRSRFGHVSAWVIDSFWVERIPRTAKKSLLFDQLFITTAEDVPEWTHEMKTPATWLPWGTDALRLGGSNPDREWDLTRIGREPCEWEDDAVTKQLCSKKNIRFHGRLKGYDDATENQKRLMQLFRHTKFLLAFSNTANPENYTHPTREYLTARWTDALACGAVVAGIPPKEPSVRRLLWDGATLDLDTVNIEQGLEVISQGIHGWTRKKAETNHLQALIRLDWRWRFEAISRFTGEPCSRLRHELQLLRKK